MSPYILLGFIIAGFLHVFVKPQMMSRHLSGSGIMPVYKAALLGIPLPLCSCGVLPTAVSLRRQGASKGAVTSFLIATPQTGVDSIAATYSLLGLPFALLRPIGALVGAMVGGVGVVKLDGDKQTPHTDCQSMERQEDRGDASSSFVAKCVEAFRYGLVDMVGNVGKWLVIGLVIASLITVLVPDELFLSLADYPLLAMLLMVAVSIPMYVCATGSIPIALSLIAKGLTPGVGFVLLMAGPAANFASMMILSKSIGRRSTLIYVGSVVVVSLLFGLMIDYLFPREWFMPSSIATLTISCHETFNWFETSCSVLLAALLIYSAIRSGVSRHEHKDLINGKTNNDMRQVFNIEGMECAHCAGAVRKAVEVIDGIENVSVDHQTGTLVVEGDFNPDKIREAVFEAGFALKE
ncbi:MAG: SO_0444 family Cu/Zn efflux transporter [Bacteroides sp.]|nr:SO_0444 family Cu/Zn efflux transporter [Bacteroides sp.]